MEEINWGKIKSNVKTIGMKTFIKYYFEFEKLTVKDLIEIFNLKEKWGYNSMNTKASMGKRIFREQNDKHVLELILSSNSDKNTIEKASEIYSEKYPNSDLKLIRFIRPEFEFGKKIIEKLFDGYKIVSQYAVKGYKIDWYIPELNIAIEFDEKHHSKNDNIDKVRQSIIEKNLKCKFLRYKY